MKKRTQLRRALGSERGLSLYEALIAVALLGMGAAMVSQLGQFVPDPKASLKRGCEGHAQLVAIALQEETFYRDLLNIFPTDGTVASRTIVPSVPRFLNNSRAVPNLADYWRTTPVVAGAFTVTDMPTDQLNGVALRNGQLIQGTMRSLSAIYNNNPAVRCAVGAYAPLTDIPPTANALPMPTDLLLRAPEVRISIRPYDTETGATGCGPATVFARPQGEFRTNGRFSAFAPRSGGYYPPPANIEEYVTGGGIPQPATTGPTSMAPNASIAHDSVLTDTIGFDLNVQVRYTGDDGIPFSETCLFSQKFEYPRDRSAPPPPNVVKVTSNPTWPQASCSANVVSPYSTTLEIGYDASLTGGMGEFERGSVFLCRDLSWIKGFLADGPGPVFASAICMRGGAPDLLTKIRPPPGYDPSATGPGGTSFVRGPGGVDAWVPCEQLTQCAVSPSSVTYSHPNSPLPNVNRLNGTGANSHKYTLNYPDLPLGCVMNFEVVTVDTAGNTSVVNDDTRRRFLDDGTPGILPETEMHYGGCGGYYTPGPAYYGVYTLNGGYYSCP